MRKILVLIVLALLTHATEAAAGAWTMPKGQWWFKLAGIVQTADEFYARRAAVLPDGTTVEPGDKRPYEDNGHSELYGVWLDTEFGVTDRFTLGLQAVWKDLRYEDDASRSQSWGWGDLWAVGRFGILTGEQRLSVVTRYKFPTGDFSTDTGHIPIGENQPDLDLGLQWGMSLGREMSWVGAETLYRFRFEDESRAFDPGDEWVLRAEAGWGIAGGFGLKGSWIMQRGDDTSLNFFAPGTDLDRDFDLLELFAMFRTRWAFVEFGVSHSIGSDSWPASPLWSLSFARAFDFFPAS